MKLLLAVITIFHLTSAATVFKVKTVEEVFAIEDDCLKRVPEAAEYFQHEIYPATPPTNRPDIFADVPAVHKAWFCIIEGMGLNTKTPGRLDLESTLLQFRVDPYEEKYLKEYVKVVKTCIAQDNGKDDTENIYKQLKCISDNNK